MKLSNSLILLLNLMMVPSFARSMPAPPTVGTEPIEANTEKSQIGDHEVHQTQSNVGAVNEGGGSANTNGMSNGLSPNSSGSGTNSARAGDQSGISLGGTSSGPTSTDTNMGTGTVKPGE